VTTAFVLSGDGSLGAVQVGMLQALTERGETPDLLVGTSAGALNAAYVAGHGTSRTSLDTHADPWAGLRRRDLFPLSPGGHLLALTRARESTFSPYGLRALISKHLPYRLLEDAPIPVYVVATKLLSGEEVLQSTGDAISAVLASTAIPGLLPAVLREGLVLVDGGLANNAAISQAVALGADRIFVLPTGVVCALTKPPASPFASAMQGPELPYSAAADPRRDRFRRAGRAARPAAVVPAAPPAVGSTTAATASRTLNGSCLCTTTPRRAAASANPASPTSARSNTVTSNPLESTSHRPSPDSGPHLRLVSDAAPVDVPAAEEAIRALLIALGQDPGSEHLRDTPRRVAAAYAELLTPEAFTLTTFGNDEGYDELVLARDLPFQSLCEHHLLPFSGVAHIGYLPGTRILGLSKLSRVLDRFARGLQVQERLTKQVADCLHETLQPKGVAVVLEAEHQCMSLRGVRAHGSRTVTSALHGLLRDNAASRGEFFALTGVGR
jgi:GTP cyclohydrolase IA